MHLLEGEFCLYCDTIIIIAGIFWGYNFRVFRWLSIYRDIYTYEY